jgi:hypothetical protein
MKNPFPIAWEAMLDGIYSWKYRKRIKTHAVEEIPDSMDRRFLYLIGEGNPWAAAMLCPCGCGETIHLSLLQNDSPSWRLRLDRGGLPTLAPSVWRTKGCRSHFFLRQGNIVWCKSEQRWRA